MRFVAMEVGTEGQTSFSFLVKTDAERRSNFQTLRSCCILWFTKGLCVSYNIVLFILELHSSAGP